MNGNTTNSAWIKANAGRRYRVQRNGQADGLGLIPVTIVKISADRRGWSTRNIRMRHELSDTDDAAALALQEHEFLDTAQLGKVNGRNVSVLDVVNVLRA